MNVAVYIRVSTDRQHDKNLSVPGQIAAAETYAKQHSMRIVAKFIEESGETATNIDRPEFQKMFSEATRKNGRRFDGVIVWAFDRFTRYDDGEIALIQMRMSGVRVFSITETMNVTDDDSGLNELFETMSLKLAKMENKKRSANVRRGMQTAAAGGAHNGKVAYGYRRTLITLHGRPQAPRLELNPATAPTVQLMFELALNGLGCKAIAQRLNADNLLNSKGRLWSRLDVYRMLSNEVYSGTLSYGKRARIYGTKKTRRTEPASVIRVENAHPAIVSQETFKRVRELISSRKPASIHPRAAGSDYLLSGLISCSCGVIMHGQQVKRNDSNYNYYHCPARANANGRCQQRRFERYELETHLLDALSERLLEPDVIRSLVSIINTGIETSTAPTELAAVETQLANARRRLSNVMNAIADGTIDHADAKDIKSELNKQIADLEPRLYELAATVAETPTRLREDDVERYIQNLVGTFMGAEPEAQKSMIRSFIQSVSIQGQSMHVQYLLPLPTKNSTTATNSSNFSVLNSTEFRK